jgi:hypothetical protein
MASFTERKLGYGFGLLGAFLIAVGGIVALILGAANLVTGHVLGGASMLSEAVVLFVIGALAAFFAYLGSHGWSDHPITSGVILVVVALLGWALLGLGANVVALVGGIFVFLAGLLYLVDPATRAVHAVATA